MESIGRGLPFIYRDFWWFGSNWHAVCKLLGMTAAAPANDLFDVRHRYVRFVQEHASGMVEFEFAVGEPQLFVEMVMPRAEFEQFCRDQGVAPTHGALPEADIDSAEHEWDWSLRTARERHFRDQS